MTLSRGARRCCRRWTSRPTARVLKELDSPRTIKRKTPRRDAGVPPAAARAAAGRHARSRARRSASSGRAFGAAGGAVGGGHRAAERRGAAARSAVRQRHHAAAERLLGAARGRPAAVAAAEAHDRPVRAAAARAPVPRDGASPAVHGAALVAHDIGPIGEARAFDVARRGEHTLRGRPGRPAGAAARPAGDVRRRPARAPDAGRGRRPPRPRRGRARAAARRDHRLPSPAVGGLGGGAGRGAGARRRRAAQAPGGRARHRIPLRHRRARRARRAARRTCRPRLLAIGDPSRAADRGQRRRDHRRTAVAARSAADSALDRMRRARAPGRGGPELPARAARARDPRRAAPAAGLRAHLFVLGSPYDGLPAEHRGTPVPETTPPASLPPRCRRRCSARRRRARSTSSACRTRPR